MTPKAGVAGQSPPDEFNDRRLVVIQRNPMSGSGRGRGELLQLIHELRRRKFHVRMFGDRAALDEFIREPTRRADLRCLVAAGGDGTVADLTNRHPGIPVCLFPMGTENLLARYLKLPRCAQTIAGVIEANRVTALDSGLANGHRFLVMLGTGVDGEVVRKLHAARTGHIGYHSYVLPMLSSFTGFEPGLIEALSSDPSMSATGAHILVTNVPAYGFDLRLSPEADPMDGLLDVRVFVSPSKLRMALHAVSLKLRLPWSESGVIRFRTAELTLRPSGSRTGNTDSPVQCDGDPGPALPLQIRIDPASLHVLTR